MTSTIYLRLLLYTLTTAPVPCMWLTVHAQIENCFSEGLYRTPYQDDIEVWLSNDYWNHNGKCDILTDETDPYIVAAAPGWIRFIVDHFIEECHPDGNGEPCCDHANNYVIIEHPNGEFSGYTHMQYHSTTDLGLFVYDWVEAGDPIGIEGSVGCSTEPHLHFEVTRPEDPSDPVVLDGGFLYGERLIPVMGGFLPDPSYMTEGETYDTGPCDDDCSPTMLVTGFFGDGHYLVVRAGEQVQTNDQVPVVCLEGSVSQYRAGNQIQLLPGFTVQSGAIFHALIKGCNEQN